MSEPVATADAPAPAAPAPVVMSRPRIVAYVVTAMFIALTQGLAQGWVSAALPQIAGQLGATTTQATWLIVAFMIPKTVLPVLLIKIRTQYGLRRFTEISIITYVLVAMLNLLGEDLRSAVIMQVLAGITAAPLSTLAFLYMLEGLSAPLKIRLGLPLALTFIMLGSPLARLLAPLLMGDGDWQILHVASLGMALVSLAAAFLLPLTPTPHLKVIQPMDLVSFMLMVVGFGGLTASFMQGPNVWWTEVAWPGITMALSVAALCAAVIIELNRATPLIDIRWVLSPAILHLAGTLLIFRLLLSEQAAGAPRMFQALGLSPEQMMPLFAVIVCASVLGGLACALIIKPGREAEIHLVALAMIAIGALLDSRSTVDTRPAQLMVSQALLAFAGTLFLPPAMLVGLIQAMAKGPTYILSFIIVFLTTQAIGGTLGSGIFTTFINHRQIYHLHALSDQLAMTSAAVSGAVGQQVQALATSIPDAAARRAEAVARIGQEMARQAYVLAYNDAYFATFIGAMASIALLLLHRLRDRLAAPASPQPERTTAQPT